MSVESESLVHCEVGRQAPAWLMDLCLLCAHCASLVLLVAGCGHWAGGWKVHVPGERVISALRGGPAGSSVADGSVLPHASTALLYAHCASLVLLVAGCHTQQTNIWTLFTAVGGVSGLTRGLGVSHCRWFRTFGLVGACRDCDWQSVCQLSAPHTLHGEVSSGPARALASLPRLRLSSQHR